MTSTPKSYQRTILRTVLYIGIDVIVINLAFAFAMMLRFNLNLQNATYLHFFAALQRLMPYLSVIGVVCFAITGTDR